MKGFFTFILFCVIIGANAQLPKEGIDRMKLLSTLQPFKVDKPVASADNRHIDSTYLLADMVKEAAHSPISAGQGVIIMLHPSVGNTVVLSEKQKFGLFPQQPDSTFKTAQLVKYNDSTYTILFQTIYGDRYESTVSLSEVLQMYLKIESIEPAPQMAAVAEKSKANVSGSDEISVLDVLGGLIHASAQILILIADCTNGHHGSSYYSEHSKYDASKSYLAYPQDHYTPKDEEVR